MGQVTRRDAVNKRALMDRRYIDNDCIDNRYDAVIVGGGMVGAAIACALGQKSLRVALFDCDEPVPFDASQPPDLRVSALSYSSEQLLKNLGAWPFMEQMRMCPYRRMAVWEKLHTATGSQWPKRLNRILFNAEDIGHRQLGYIVENRVTQLGLLAVVKTLDCVDLFCPSSISDIDLTGSSPGIHLSDGRCFKGQVVIGADGAQSFVQRAAGIGLDCRDYEQHCFVATVEIEGGAQDITWQAFTKTGPEAFLPLPDVDGRSYGSIVWYHQPERVRQLARMSEGALLDELMTLFPKELPPLIRVVNSGFFPIARRHVAQYCRSGVVLVGDAAHTVNPLAGQGVNLGFKDVAWLAEVLLKAQENGEPLGRLDVLGRYEKARRRDNQLMMTAMDFFYYTFSNEIKPLKLARNFALGLAGISLPTFNKFMEYTMGLSGKQPDL